MCSLCLLLAVVSLLSCHAFVPALTLRKSMIKKVAWTGNRKQLPIFSTSKDDNNNNDNFEAMRKVLETSWNTQTMGAVPTNPEVAATAAAKAIQQAKMNGNNNNNVFFVDLLLPQYDISAGSNLYDDVLAAEFCIRIANRLEGRSAIYVKNQNVLTTINRILESRESAQVQNVEVDEYEEVEVEVDEDEYEYDNDDDIQVSETPQTSIEFYDDFADFTGIGGSVFERSDIPLSPLAGIDKEPPTSSRLDVTSFREQLLSTWDTDGNPTSLPPRDIKPKVKANKTIIKRIKKEKLNPIATDPLTKNYRLTSMFGDSSISKGTDMSDDVVSALRVNARPLSDEDTMIILSAISREESIALQSLVVSFQSTKTIILVNCKVEQLPRELSKVETVYSVLPLVAKADGNNSGPKLVVLRQYPGNWQVHVDADGQGFQLATEAPAEFFPKRGPPMEWIAKCLKKFLQSRLG